MANFFYSTENKPPINGPHNGVVAKEHVDFSFILGMNFSTKYGPFISWVNRRENMRARLR